MENNYLNVGIIINTRGLKGVVKIKSTTYFSTLRYKKGNKLFLVNENSNTFKEVTVNSYVQEKGFDYVSFEEINSIDEAEKYKGWYVQVDITQTPTLEKNTYYFKDLINLSCFDEDNNFLGTVKSVEDYTPQISLRILLPNSKTVLIPFVKFYIKKVDLDNKSIIIHTIPGLI